MRWPKAFGAATAIIALSCSLAFASFSHSQLNERLLNARTPADFRDAARYAADGTDSDYVSEAAQRVLETGGGDKAANASLKRLAFVLEVADAMDQQKPGNVSQEAKALKKSRFVTGFDDRERSNWLAKALERFKGFKFPESEAPPPSLPPLGLSKVMVGVVWGILVSAVLLFLFFALRHFNWKRNLLQKSKAVMLDSEPDRTLEEWLDLARLHETRSEFREACRALYIAALIRLDHAKVARFIRGQTNWEHLRRIEAHALGSRLGFRDATMRFDRIWYGHAPASAEDASAFWHGLERLETALKEAA